ncbi:hypothetical protein SNE40_009061 [Patella caerulea]|uniref:HD domain-containing protein n=1 Tax=Patella caerulea TaxID=87958 RepID=A0AAN8JQB7_PATCE
MTEKAVDDIIRLFNLYGETNYLGESVSKTQHMIQCGRLAQQHMNNLQVTVGALLHDIGHLIGIDRNTVSMVTDDQDLGAKDHDTIGGNYLRELCFPSLVCELVSGHVQAKRYLVYKDKKYYEKLSPASKMTLEHQGGPMSQQEAEKFSNSPLFDVILSMRKWDELAKNMESPPGSIEDYRDYLNQVLHLQ